MHSLGFFTPIFRVAQITLYLKTLKTTYHNREVAYAVPPARALQFITLLFMRILVKI